MSMFRLRTGYIVTGIITGLILTFSFIRTLPDGRLHVVFCSVGQGDAAYVRFPDGRDLLVDGGPNASVVGCLGRHMPFWDRQIDMVILSHPQKDHMAGLVSVLERYKVRFVVRSDIAGNSDIYEKFVDAERNAGITERMVMRGESVSMGNSLLSVLWPTDDQLAYMEGSAVLGASTVDLNDGSVVFLLSYGSFDVLFPGDADMRVEAGYIGAIPESRPIEILKIPHHGSRTGMSDAYIDRVHPDLAVISVGKNSYGHPAPEILDMLKGRNIKTMRTDEEGDIEVTSDGKGWEIESSQK